MRKPWHPLPLVLLMLSVATLASCANTPPVPVVTQCPKMADPPEILMQPARSTDATIELQRILEDWLETARPMRQP